MPDITLYDRATLDTVYRFQKLPTKQFWLPQFGRQLNFDTPYIMWDRVYGDDRGLAPFVLPNVKGRPQKLQTYDSIKFAPAYSKIKDVVTPEMHIERVPGENPIVGNLSIEQRRDAVKAELLRRQKIKFANLEEWMACQALTKGSVVVQGEDYPAVTVDFRRDGSLTIVKAGNATWDTVGVDPLADLKAARIAVNNLSGTTVNKYVFGGNAWGAFAKRVNLRDLMDKNYGGQQVNVSLISDGYDGQEYMGYIQGPDGQGRLDLWVDNSKYVDETGTLQFYMDQDTVVGIGNGFDGIRCYGAIFDARAGFQPLTRFFKNWLEEDPSHEYILGQTSPLMVPKNPNTTFSMRVR